MLGVQVAVSPLLAFFLCVSGIKHKVLHDEDGRWGNSFVARRKPLGVQLEGGGPLCVLRTQLSTEMSASLQVRRQPHTHNTQTQSNSFSLFNPDSSYTPTPTRTHTYPSLVPVSSLVQMFR